MYIAVDFFALPWYNVNVLNYYKYDEIGLYYLQSRYYNATVGRFINSDSIEILNFNDKNAISIQYGLFTYAVNDPVNEVDFAGSYSIGKVIKTVLSAIGKGLLSQFYTDMILYAFDVLVLNKNVELKLSPGEDYAYSVLCALVDEFLSTPRYMMYIKLAGIAAKYLWKFVCGRMQSKDWGTLVVDVLRVIVEYYLKNLQKKYSSQIKKLKKKRKNSKNLERIIQSKKNTGIIIKIYYCGIHLEITLPVSNLLLSFVLNIIFW